MDNNTTDHGNEPATFPSIEVEKHLSRIEGLISHLQKSLPEIWMREQAQDIHEAANEARGHFREFLNETRAERMRLIELTSSPRVV